MIEIRDGVWRCALLGVCAGAMEMIWHGLSLAVQPALVDWVALSAAVGASFAAWFGLIGAAASVLLLQRKEDRALPGSHQLAVTAFLGTASVLLPAVRELVERKSQLGIAIFGMLIVLVMLLTYFTSRLLLRRAARGARGLPLPAVALGVHGAASLAAPALVAFRAPTTATFDTQNVVLVTVDGMGADEEGPAWQAFAAEGVRFTQAVSPIGTSRAANAAALVGLHPLRTRVLTDRDHLSAGHRSAFEELEDAGYVTGAFLSSVSVASGSGLEQGFGTYDDAFVPGWQRSTLVGRLASRSGSRSAADTMTAFEAWARPRAGLPFAVWIHLSDPARDPSGTAAAPAVDSAIGRLRAFLESEELLGRTAVLLAGTGGRGGRSALPAIGDDRVWVPMALRLTDWLQVKEVEAQVRLVDVANTLLDAAEIPLLDQSEGVSLGNYGSGLRKAPMNATVIGQDPQGKWMIGVRNNGLKVAVYPDGASRLFDLAADPLEQKDIAAENAETMTEAGRLIEREHAALRDLLER